MGVGRIVSREGGGGCIGEEGLFHRECGGILLPKERTGALERNV